MKPIRPKTFKSIFAAIAVSSLLIIVFTSGLFWLFFDKQLTDFFAYLDENVKAISALVKTIVFISGLILLATPVLIVCCMYTYSKDHYYYKKTPKNDRLNSYERNTKGNSLQADTLNLSPNFDDRNFDNFMKSELEKIQNDLTLRRDEYLSIYNDGPAFLTEARDRFKNKMSRLLDYQDEVILSMHSELHLKVKAKIKYYQKQMRHGLQNDSSSLHLLSEYSNQMDDFYSEVCADFETEIINLNSELQALSDDHFDKLQNLSIKFSSY